MVLALVGHKRWAPEVNAAMSFATLCAAALLTAKVVADGPMVALDEQFFVDPFNVFLVALTAFVGFTTALFSRPYMRIEEHHGRLNSARLRLYHSMYQLFSFTMVLCLLSNNVGILWVALEGATLNAVGEIMKRFPGVHTVCGLTNVSYGLPARKLINRTFLVAAITKGLDSAIIDPTDKLLYAMLKAATLIVGKDDYCKDYICAFREGRVE